MTTRPAEPTCEAAAALAQVVAGLDRLAAVASWQAGDDDLAAAVAGLAQVVRLAEAQTVRLAAEAAGRGLPGRQGHGRLAGWVQAQQPTTSPREAIATARRAEALYARPVAAELAPTRV